MSTKVKLGGTRCRGVSLLDQRPRMGKPIWILLLTLSAIARPMGLSSTYGQVSGATPVLILSDANQPALSANGRSISVLSEVGVTEVFDFPSGRKINTLRRDNSIGSWISGDGKHVMVFAFPQGPTDENVWLYDAVTGRELRGTNTYAEYEGKFVGRLIVYGGDSESTNNITSDLRWIAGPATYPIHDLGALKDKNKPGVWLWDINQHRILRSFGTFEIYDEFSYDSWHHVRLTPDGRLLAASRTNPKRSDKRETIVWDAQSGRQLLRLPFSSNWLAVSDGGKRLITSRAQTDGGNPNDVGVIPGRNLNTAFKLNISEMRQNGGLYVTEVWDIASGSCVSMLGKELVTNPPPMVRGAISPDGKFVLTASLDRVLVWDAGSGRLLATQPHIEGGTDRVKSVAFSSDGKYIIMSSTGEIVKVWLLADVMKKASVDQKTVALREAHD